MTSEAQIEQILIEASSYNLRIEVMEWAKKLLQENPKLNRVHAYEMAFNEWVK